MVRVRPAFMPVYQVSIRPIICGTTAASYCSEAAMAMYTFQTTFNHRTVIYNYTTNMINIHEKHFRGHTAEKGA